jgi:hypothetical protein
MPRKPTALLKLSGSASKHPDRLAARANEPVPDPVFGNAPRTLTKKQQTIWREFIGEVPSLVLSKSDRKLVEIAVRMIDRVRDGSAKSSDFATLLKCLIELGMTPVSRSKVSTLLPPDPNDGDGGDPFADFVGDAPNA